MKLPLFPLLLSLFGAAAAFGQTKPDRGAVMPALFPRSSDSDAKEKEKSKETPEADKTTPTRNPLPVPTPIPGTPKHPTGPEWMPVEDAQGHHNIFTCDFAGFPVGSPLPKEIARDCTVMEENGIRFIRATAADGEIRIQSLQFPTFPGTFTLETRFQGLQPGFQIAILADDGSGPKLEITKSLHMTFGDQKKSLYQLTTKEKIWHDAQSPKSNTIRLQGDGKTLKVLLNDQFFASQPWTDSHQPRTLKISGIAKKAKVLELKAVGQSVRLTPPTLPPPGQGGGEVKP